MKNWITLLTLLLSLPLMAEVIDDMEYQLPESKQGWKEASQMKNERSTTIFYVPNDTTLETSPESFSVHTNNMAAFPIPLKAMDVSSLRKTLLQTLQQQLGEEPSAINVINLDDKSALYEFSSGSGKNEVHALVRTFDTNNGTAIVMYTANNAKLLQENRSQIIETLEKAKIN